MRHLLLVVVGCAAAPAFAYGNTTVKMTSAYLSGCSTCHAGSNGGTTTVGVSNVSGSTAGTISPASGFFFTVGVSKTVSVWVRNDTKSGAGYVMTANTGVLAAGVDSETCTTAPCVQNSGTKAMSGAGANRAASFAVNYTGSAAGTVTFSVRGAAVNSDGAATGDTPDLLATTPTFTALVCGLNQHACGGVCVNNTSTATCGISCTPCASPANSFATCDGTTCGFQCSSNYHRCGGTCASNTSTATCGASCTACPSPVNGTATCNGTSCGVQCNVGSHLCGGTTCVSNTSTATCGSSCTACVAPANSIATCNGTICDFQCTVGYARSGNTCVANNTPSCCTNTATCPAACTAPANGTAVCGPGNTCDFTCAINYTRQNGACLLNESPACCGVACTICPLGPANSAPACLQGTCTFACNAGFAKNLAGTACVPNLTAACCTSSSVCPAPCPGDANGVVGCSSGQCTLSCNVGFVPCGGVCVPATSPTSCGASCTTCPAPVNGTATCDGTSCGFTCATGAHRCGQACARDDATETCGASCTPCAATANSTVTCSGGACGFTCDVGFAKNAALTACVPSGTVACCTTGSTCPAPCGAAANSVATCSALGTCDFSCTQGYLRVGAECRLSGSNRCCGGACSDCTMVSVPTNATATCTADVCGFECTAGFELDASQTRCVAIGGDAGVVDAGVVDAGVVDAGVVDAGVVDAGVMDAGVVDAGVEDAGVMDAGAVDAGVVEPDGGLVGGDAGVASGADGGASPVDAGPSPGTGGGTGCGCTTPGGAAGWWLSLAGLAHLARARRRRHGVAENAEG